MELFFQVALLNRRNRPVDQNEAQIFAFHQMTEFLNLAFAKELAGMRTRKTHHIAAADL